jgi:CRP-like cAMP-binding protein
MKEKYTPVPMLDALRQYLSAYVTFTDEEFNVFSRFVEIRNFDKKQQVIKIGEREIYLNFIVKGAVRKYFLKGKDEIITQLAKENDIINSTSSYEEGKPSTYIIETIEPTTFVSITKEHLDSLFLQSHKMERLGRLVATSLFLQKDAWEYERMRLSTRERFVQFMRNNPDLLQRVPQKYLASYLNIKPETFSRLKHLLQKKK